MAGGVALFLGCMLYAFTVRPDVHWIVPAIGITIIIGEWLDASIRSLGRAVRSTMLMG